jgi:xanthine/CO dehydrogenase XdhC/CoxF family maturation factor
MLLYADGSHLGLLSGGCLEGDLALHAQRVLRAGRAEAVEYDMRGPDDALYGIGAGCEGAMRLLLEPAHAGTPAARALDAARAAAQLGEGSALIAVHDGAAESLGTREGAGCLAPPLVAAYERVLSTRTSVSVDERPGTGALRAFVQWLAPPPRILICGAGDDAVPVVAGLVALGWTVLVTDHRPRYAQAARFPGALVHCQDADALAATIDLPHCHAALVMSHHLKSDAAYLAALAHSGQPRFVGLLGPRARRERLLAEGGAALREALHGRLRGPVGLDIGAVTPEGIALSIVAELHAYLAGRVATPAVALAG